MAFLLSFTIMTLYLRLCQGALPAILTSDVDMGGGFHVATTGQAVQFQCSVTNALLLDWIAEPFIDRSDPIRFVPDDSVMTTETRGQLFTGTITVITPSSDPLFASITSTLSFVAQDSFNGLRIMCSDGITTTSATLYLSSTKRSQLISNVQYDGRNVACPNQNVIFQCQVTNTSLLEWVAEPFINSSNPIQFVPDDNVMTTETRGQFTGTVTDISPSSDPLIADITSTLSFTASAEVNGTVIECFDGTTRVNDIISVTGIPPLPTAFVCSDVPCESGDSVTVQCQWQIPDSTGPEPVFFTITRPDGMTVMIPGNQNNFTFDTACQIDNPQVVTIASNCNTENVSHTINIMIPPGTTVAGVVAGVVAAVLAAVVAAVVITVVVLFIMKFGTSINRNQDLEFLINKSHTEEQAMTEPTEMKRLGDTSGTQHSLKWKSQVPCTRQYLSVFQLNKSREIRIFHEKVSGTSRNVELPPGGHYKAAMTVRAGCLSGQSTTDFLTEVSVISKPNDLVVYLNRSPSNDIAVEFECAAEQPTKVIWYVYKPSDGHTKLFEETLSTGVRRQAILDPSKLDKVSGVLTLYVEIETLPTSGRNTSDLKKCLVTTSPFTVTVKVLPRQPLDINWTQLTVHSGEISWNQIYETEDEKPTKFYLKMPHLEYKAPCTVLKYSTSGLHRTTLEHLKPGLKYHVTIQAENKNGMNESGITFTMLDQPPTPTLVSVSSHEAVLSCDLREKKNAEYTLVVLDNSEPERKVLERPVNYWFKPVQEIKVEVSPDTMYTAYLAVQNIKSDSVIFTSPVEILSLQKPEEVLLGDTLHLTARFRVNINKVRISCDIPQPTPKPTVKSQQTKDIIEATIDIEDAKDGKYVVLIKSLPSKPNSEIKPGKTEKFIDVNCKAPPYEAMNVNIEDVQAQTVKIHWNLSRLPEGFFKACTYKLSVEEEKVDDVEVTKGITKDIERSIDGSLEFSDLQPSTEYCASIIATHTKLEFPLKRYSESFITKAYEAKLKVIHSTPTEVKVQLKVTPTPPVKSKLVVTESGFMKRAYPEVLFEARNNTKTFTIRDLKPDMKYTAVLNIDGVKKAVECDGFITKPKTAYKVEFSIIDTTAAQMIAQWKVIPTPPTGSTLVVVKKGYFTNTPVEKYRALPQEAEKVHVVTIRELESDTKYLFQVAVDESVIFTSQSASTLKSKGYNSSLKIPDITATSATVEWDLGSTHNVKSKVMVKELGITDPIASESTSPATLSSLKPNTTYIVLLLIDGMGKEAVDCCSFTTSPLTQQTSQF